MEHKIVTDKLLPISNVQPILRPANTELTVHHPNTVLGVGRQRPTHTTDHPSIGIILCAEKDDIEVEFAFKTKMNPIGVSEYQLQTKPSAELKGRLPSAKQLADAIRDILPSENR